MSSKPRKKTKQKPAEQEPASLDPKPPGDSLAGLSLPEPTPLQLAMLAAQFLPNLDLSQEEAWQNERRSIFRVTPTCPDDPDNDLDEDSPFGLVCEEAIKRARILLSVASLPLSPPNRQLYNERLTWLAEVATQHGEFLRGAQENWQKDFAEILNPTVADFLKFAMPTRTDRMREAIWREWQKDHTSLPAIFPVGADFGTQIPRDKASIFDAAHRLHKFIKSNYARIAKAVQRETGADGGEKSAETRKMEKKALDAAYEKLGSDNSPIEDIH